MVITPKTAVKILIAINSITILFHLMVMIEIIPYTIAWGGRLKTWEEMVVFESLSVIINLLFMIVLLMHGRFIRKRIHQRFITFAFWILLVLFSFNTIGNLVAQNGWERAIGTPITLTIAILLWIIIRDPAANKAQG